MSLLFEPSPILFFCSANQRLSRYAKINQSASALSFEQAIIFRVITYISQSGRFGSVLAFILHKIFGLLFWNGEHVTDFVFELDTVEILSRFQKLRTESSGDKLSFVSKAMDHRWKSGKISVNFNESKAFLFKILDKKWTKIVLEKCCLRPQEKKKILRTRAIS